MFEGRLPTRDDKHRELARRLFIAKVSALPLYRCSKVETIVDGEPCWVPSIAEALSDAHIGWSQVADLGRQQLIYLTRAAPPGLPPDARVQDPDALDWNALIPPLADEAAGHFSEAHNYELYHEPFGTAYDPLSLYTPDFDAFYNNELRSVGGVVRHRTGQTSSAYYRWVTDEQPPDDCSAEWAFLALTTVTSGGKVANGVLLRTDAGASPAEWYRGYLLYDETSDTLVAKVVKYVGGVLTTLGTSGSISGTPSSGLGRFEAVGSTLKVYCDGNEELSVSDGSLSSGYAGPYSYRLGTTGQDPELDNLKLFIATDNWLASGRGRFLFGINQGAAQGRGAFYIVQNQGDQSGLGLYRVADANAARYQLWDGVDGSPDLSAAADATSATLPMVRALSADHTHHIVVRERNAWDLLSQNVGETVFEIAADGSVVNRPSAPQDVAIEAAAAGAARVQAAYFYEADSYAADTFLVYLTSDGTDPDPDVDVPTEVTMTKFDGVAKLDWTSGVLGDALTAKAIVRTRRSGTPDVDSDNTDIVSCTTSTSGPDTPDGDIFFGQMARQAQ